MLKKLLILLVLVPAVASAFTYNDVLNIFHLPHSDKPLTGENGTITRLNTSTGSSNSKWATTTGSTITPNGGGAVLILGSTTLQNFTAQNGTSTTFATGTLCLTSDICRTTWPSSTGGGISWPFTKLSTGEQATSTTVALLNGFLSTASSTFTTGPLILASTTLQNFTFQNATGTNATTTGSHYVVGTVYASNFVDTALSGNACIGESSGVLGQATNCVSSIASSGSSLTVSSPTGNVDVSVNLGHSNVWNALQTFTNASSTLFSSTIASTSQLMLSGKKDAILSVDANGWVVASTTIGNNQLQNSGVTINAASPLGGGGALSLGGTLNLTCTGCLTSMSFAWPFTKQGDGFQATSTGRLFTGGLVTTSSSTIGNIAVFTPANGSGIGTSTPDSRVAQLQIASSTLSQLSLIYGAGTSNINFNNLGSMFAIATTSATTYATSSANLLSFDLNGALTLPKIGTGFLKSTSGVITSDATAYTATSRSLTISGTSNQITSSAGAQDLSADRTWTLSIPATFHIATASSTVLDIGNAFFGQSATSSFNGAGALFVVGSTTLQAMTSSTSTIGILLSNRATTTDLDITSNHISFGSNYISATSSPMFSYASSTYTNSLEGHGYNAGTSTFMFLNGAERKVINWIACQTATSTSASTPGGVMMTLYNGTAQSNLAFCDGNLRQTVMTSVNSIAPFAKYYLRISVASTTAPFVNIVWGSNKVSD